VKRVIHLNMLDLFSLWTKRWTYDVCMHKEFTRCCIGHMHSVWWLQPYRDNLWRKCVAWRARDARKERWQPWVAG
jgi:hypothetical protein